jgi:hypothetical protein
MVMVVSLIIVLITTTIVYSVRQKVATALELNDRSASYLKSYSAHNQVLYSFLTSVVSSAGLEIRDENGEKLATLNYYGAPIELAQGISVKLRDISGMISPLFHMNNFRKFVEHVSQDSKLTNTILDALADWQDRDNIKKIYGAESKEYSQAGYSFGPRNFLIQLPEEIMLLKGFDDALFGQLVQDTAYWSNGKINYMTMSDRMLKALLGNDSMVERLVALREKGRLTPTIFREITGIPAGGNTIYTPSDYIKVEIETRVRKAVSRIDSVIVKRESARRPYMVLEWKS